MESGISSPTKYNKILTANITAEHTLLNSSPGKQRHLTSRSILSVLWVCAVYILRLSKWPPFCNFPTKVMLICSPYQFLFLRRLTVYPWLAWHTLRVPGSPQSHRSAGLCCPSIWVLIALTTITSSGTFIVLRQGLSGPSWPWLDMQPRITLSLWFPYLHLQGTRITGLCHQTQLPLLFASLTF